MMLDYLFVYVLNLIAQCVFCSYLCNINKWYVSTWFSTAREDHYHKRRHTSACREGKRTRIWSGMKTYFCCVWRTRYMTQKSFLRKSTLSLYVYIRWVDGKGWDSSEIMKKKPNESKDRYSFTKKRWKIQCDSVCWRDIGTTTLIHTHIYIFLWSFSQNFLLILIVNVLFLAFLSTTFNSIHIQNRTYVGSMLYAEKGTALIT